MFAYSDGLEALKPIQLFRFVSEMPGQMSTVGSGGGSPYVGSLSPMERVGKLEGFFAIFQQEPASRLF